jgi:hypothetical protein
MEVWRHEEGQSKADSVSQEGLGIVETKDWDVLEGHSGLKRWAGNRGW